MLDGLVHGSGQTPFTQIAHKHVPNRFQVEADRRTFRLAPRRHSCGPANYLLVFASRIFVHRATSWGYWSTRRPRPSRKPSLIRRGTGHPQVIAHHTPRSRSATKHRSDAIQILTFEPASPLVNSFTTAAMGSPKLSLDGVLMSPPFAPDNLAVGIRDRGNTLSLTIVGVGAHNIAIPPHGELVGFPSHSGERSPSASRAKNQDDRCDGRRSKSRFATNLREMERSLSNHRAASTTGVARGPLSRSPPFERDMRTRYPTTPTRDCSRRIQGCIDMWLPCNELRAISLLKPRISPVGF